MSRDKAHPGPTLLGSRAVRRSQLVSAISHELALRGLAAFLVEPGMGERFIIHDVVKRFASLGSSTVRYRFSRKSFLSSAKRLRRCLSEVRESVLNGLESLVVIEDLYANNDEQAYRLGSLLELFSVVGCRVVVVIDPDSEHLLDYAGNYRIYRSDYFLVSASEQDLWSNYFDGYDRAQARAITNGIPGLLSALRGSSVDLFGYPVGQPWASVSARLLSYALRSGLVDEELAVRCALAALGSGQLSDLAQLGIRVSDDMVSLIERDAPIFGIDVSCGSFSLAACSPEVVGGVLSACRVEFAPGLIARCVDLLVSKGDVRRAALIARECPALVDCESLANRNALELFDCGMHSFLTSHAKLARADENRENSCKALLLGLLGLVDWDVAERALQTIGESPLLKRRIPEDDRELLLLLAAHHAKCQESASGGTRESEVRELCDCGLASGGRIARLLAAHARVVALCLSGRASDAYKFLMLLPEAELGPASRVSVFEAVLAKDVELVGMIVRDMSLGAARTKPAWANEVLETCAPSRLCEEVLVAERAVRFALGQSRIHDATARVAAQAELRGQHLLASRLHMVQGLAGAAAGSVCQAGVQIAEAGRSAGRAGSGEALAAVRISERALGLGEGQGGARRDSPRAQASRRARGGAQGAAARSACGGSSGIDIGPTRDFGANDPALSCRGDLSALAEMQKALECGVREGIRDARARLRRENPRPEAAILAALLVRVDIRHGGELRCVLPEGWTYAISRGGEHALPAAEGLYPATMSRDCGPKASHLGHASRRAPAEGARASSGRDYGKGDSERRGCHLEVRVLGGISAAINGREIPESAWTRAHARTLLAMLALSPGHAISRLEAIETIWPESDFVRGRESLYTVLSSLRGTLNQVPGADSYVAGEMGRLWLNSGAVSCDVDELEGLLRTAIDTRVSDEEVLACCRRAEAMYRGGTVVPAADARGGFRRRHEETARRYVDAMLAGCEAATRLGDARCSAWMAESAATVLPERPDVRKALAESRGERVRSRTRPSRTNRSARVPARGQL